jgi:hypothetical protein
MDDWLRFLGFWIAEGSALRAKPKDGFPDYAVSLASGNDEALEEMRRILGGWGLHVWKSYRKEGAKLGFHNKQLHNYLSQFGRSSEKFVPDYVKNLSPRQISIFLEAYASGDGSSYDDGRICAFWTSSTRLRDDLMELVLKAGKSGNYRLCSDEVGSDVVVHGRRTGQQRHNTWRVSMLHKQTRPRVSKQRSEYYGGSLREDWVDHEGFVSCVEVPNHTLYVRRGGKPVWCGNSTAIACIRLGVPFVGFEIDEGYVKVAEERIRREQALQTGKSP